MKKLVIVIIAALSLPAFADDHQRTITVSGSGFAEAKPDRANVQMSVVARKKTVAEAQSEAAQVTSRVLSMTGKLGVEKEDIDTTGASIRPDYRWNNKTQEQELLGYVAERRITIQVKDLEKLGKIVETSVNAGVNQVTPPQLDSSKRKDAYRKALRAAAKDAEANAEQLAKTLGAKLGEAINISSGGSYPRPPMPMARGVAMMADSAEAAATYNPGDLTFNATVTVVFELTD